MTEVFVFMTDGTEECEALLMVDLFRRAGIAVETVALHADGTEVRKGHERMIDSLHHVHIRCDRTIDEMEAEAGKGDALFFIPGGKVGVENMKASSKLRSLLAAHKQAGKTMAAVCAGPTVLGAFGLIEGKEVTVYPGFEGQLGGAHYTDLPIQHDTNLITGRALGSSIPLALDLIERLRDHATALATAKQIVYDYE